MRNTVVCIGVQKAATSWLHAVMSAHPDIAGSQPKEVDFFSYYYDRGAQWYLSHFPKGAPTIFECSPSYFIDPRAPSRLFAFDPNAKIIVMLRDPVERAYSNHLHEIIKGHIDVTDFWAGLENNPTYIEQSLYFKHLSNWVEVYPPNQIRVIFQSKIKDNETELIHSLYRFVGVADNVEPTILQESRNVSDIPRSKMFRFVSHSIGNAMRRMNLEQALSKIKRTKLGASVLSSNSISLRDLIPPLSDAEMDRLQQIFADDQAKLKELIKSNQLGL